MPLTWVKTEQGYASTNLRYSILRLPSGRFELGGTKGTLADLKAEAERMESEERSNATADTFVQAMRNKEWAIEPQPQPTGGQHAAPTTTEADFAAHDARTNGHGKPASLPPTKGTWAGLPTGPNVQNIPKPSASVPQSALAARYAPAEQQDTAPHLIVEARAGTGKTTTLVCALQVLNGQIPTDAKGREITPSPQQRAVWDAVALSRGKAKSVGFVAFNKSIATELQRRVPAGVQAMTMHSLGYRAVRQALGDLALGEWVIQDYCHELLGIGPRPADPGDVPPAERKAFEAEIKAWNAQRLQVQPVVNATKELVSLCKINLVYPEDAESWAVELDRLASHYEIELTDGGRNYRDQVFALVPEVLNRCLEPRGKITYDDMIWLPVALGLPVQQFDLLLVDEAQDLNRCQQSLAKKAGKRLILCGDPKQAIYGFAGADSDSMNRLLKELGGITREVWYGKEQVVDNERGCLILPLTVTRRCGRAIVAEANKKVADFHAHESNPDGKVSTALYSHDADDRERPWEKTYAATAGPGDMVLCRVNAPLISQCFRFLKRGIKANIQGRDVAKGLVSTVTKSKANTVLELQAYLESWLEDETRKEQSKKNPGEAKLIALQDRHDCLLCFCDGLPSAGSVEMVVDRIQAIFTDNKEAPGIRLSSIHKAKGLEAYRVFFLQPKGGECPHPMAKSSWQREQEDNLWYVAVTRAIGELVFVS